MDRRLLGLKDVSRARCLHAAAALQRLPQAFLYVDEIEGTAVGLAPGRLLGEGFYDGAVLVAGLVLVTRGAGVAVGLALLASGIVYFLVLGRWLLPTRKGPAKAAPARTNIDCPSARRAADGCCWSSTRSISSTRSS